jgi:hypothetical protein
MYKNPLHILQVQAEPIILDGIVISAANEDYLDIDDILITYPCVPPAVPTLPVLGTTPICPSANSTVQATSAGNTINYWTAASGGTLIGNGASGTAFTVTPASTTTYYAEAQKSVGCVSATRLLVGTITV